MLRKQSVTSIVIPNGKMINSDQKECNLNCDLIAVTRPNSAATTAILKVSTVKFFSVLQTLYARVGKKWSKTLLLRR